MAHSDCCKSLEEHKRFIKGCLLFRNNWKEIKGYVETRTSLKLNLILRIINKIEKRKYKINELNNNNEKDIFIEIFSLIKLP